MNKISGGIIAVFAAIVICAFAFLTLGGGSDLIAGFIASKQAEKIAAQAELVQAQADLVQAQTSYVLSEAAAYSIRTDANQTWLVPVCLGLVIALLVFVVLFEVYRVTQAEKRVYSARKRLEAEDNAAIISDVNRALQYRRNAQVVPRVLEFDARGLLTEWERGRR